LPRSSLKLATDKESVPRDVSENLRFRPSARLRLLLDTYGVSYDLRHFARCQGLRTAIDHAFSRHRRLL
jgi:hypothetical protein